MSNYENTEGFKIIQNWMMEKGNSPFKFQVDTWQKFGSGYSGMVVAPTGFGKTFSVFLALVSDFLTYPEKYKNGLKMIWITPLRSLAKDIAKAMQEAIYEIGLDSWREKRRHRPKSPSATGEKYA